MNRFCKLVVVLMVLEVPVSGVEEKRPSVTVKFDIKVQLYRTYFGLENTSCIEEQTTTQIICLLKDRFGFLNFTKDPSENTLNIELDEKIEGQLTSTSKLREVGFRLNLQGSDISDENEPVPVYWMFRSKDIYGSSLGKKEGFLLSIIECFDHNLDSQSDSLVDSLFSKIKLAKEAFHYPKTLRIIMPFNLGFGRQSMFNVATEFFITGVKRSINYTTERTGITTNGDPIIPASLRNGMIESEAVSPEHHLDNLRTQGVKVTEVYIEKYRSVAKLPIISTRPEEVNVGGD